MWGSSEATPPDAAASSTQAAPEDDDEVGLIPDDVARACYAGNLVAIKAWLDADGGHVDDVWDSPGGQVRDLTLLMIASRYGHDPIVEMLLERGATLDYLASDNTDALMVAGEEGHARVVRRLLEAGARMEMSDVDDRMNRPESQKRQVEEHLEAALRPPPAAPQHARRSNADLDRVPATPTRDDSVWAWLSE